MNLTPLTKEECLSLHPGEGITIATVLCVFTVVILAVVAYKLFKGNGGKVTIPGGYKFEWASANSK